MKNVKMLLKQYPERLAFGLVFIIVLIAFVRIKIIGLVQDPLMAEVTNKEVEITNILKTNKPKQRDPSNQYTLLFDRINKSGEPQALNNWFMYRKPIYKVKIAPKITVIPPVIFPPRLDPLEIKPEQPNCVILTWYENEKTTARVKGHRIYRKVLPGGRFDRLVEVSSSGVTPTTGAVNSYQDQTVQPELIYLYRITAITDETNMVDDKKESLPSNEEKINTPGIIEITVTTAVSDEMAMIRVKKYIKEAWQQSIFRVNKDSEIGKNEKGLDFTTGYILKDIQKIKEIREMMGQRMFVDVWEITYLNSKTGKEYKRKGDKNKEIPLVP